ncbi:Uncharacterized membrane protein [Albimonas donghaensis]|uniref:Uncharacterized membrane protein n=1 Tax=Albimonas donghaensis TaxID=356660 RepID=A0A1H3CEP9_9RHOB|nr:anthrone oxygenase family protein [Albimonas donghaensis]SDX51969.1 Uncharacterized membrane protein [Albimonas donghaensis]
MQSQRLTLPARFAAGLALLLTGALFGFFYAWVCSTMWGLDAADPRVAMAAMQAMNASVRNAVFAPAFFGAAPACALAAAAAWGAGAPAAARAFGLAALLVLAGCVATFLVNVPMNETLGALPVPESREDAARIWAAYSPRWQLWNQIRAALCGVGLLAAGAGIAALARAAPRAA